jgi:hypothetical protein
MPVERACLPYITTVALRTASIAREIAMAAIELLFAFDVNESSGRVSRQFFHRTGQSSVRSVMSAQFRLGPRPDARTCPYWVDLVDTAPLGSVLHDISAG